MKYKPQDVLAGGSTARASQPNTAILVLFLVISLVGTLMILDISASRSSMHFFYKQVFFFFIGLVTAAITSAFNITHWRKFLPLFLLGCMAMLALVLVMGSTVKGATRSINLGIAQFQPSVLTRVILILFFAHVLDKRKDLISDSRPSQAISNFWFLMVVVGFVFGLILLEKHLSFIIIMSSAMMIMLWLAGFRKRTLLLLVAIAVAAGTIVITQGAKYRSNRIDMFKKYSLIGSYLGKPSDQPIKGEQHIRESLIALSSGGFAGVGTSHGMGKHYFLPEARTDYIFAIIGEEFGWLGAAIVFLLHTALFYVIMLSSWRQDDFFLKLAGCGLALNIYLNVLVNMGVAMSIIPSTGVTLPFVSYGGSSYVVNAVGIGIIMDISKSRKARL